MSKLINTADSIYLQKETIDSLIKLNKMQLDSIYKNYHILPYSNNSFFSNGTIIFIVILTAIFLFLIVMFLNQWINQITKLKLFKQIDLKFTKDLIKDKEDITLIISSISREYETTYSLAPILEDYLTYLISKDIFKENPHKLTEIYTFLKAIISKENEEKPYSNIPEEERRILKSIEDAITTKETKNVLYNLNELNSVIATRNRIYLKTERINKWSIIIAIVGAILTMVFGLLSIPNISKLIFFNYLQYLY